MPNRDEFLQRFNELRAKVDPQDLQQIMELVPPALLRDVMAIVMDPKVQAGLDQVREAVVKGQNVSIELSSTLPAAVAELREAFDQATAGAQSTVGSVDPQRIAALKAHLPGVAENLAIAGMSRPEAAPIREKMAIAFTTLFGRDSTATAGTTAANVATSYLYSGGVHTTNATSSTLARYAKVAVDVVAPKPYVMATTGVITAFAAARGVTYEDELRAWAWDSGRKEMFSGAVNRYASAQGMDALSADAQQAATAKMVATLENLFAGVAQLWLNDGSTPAVQRTTAREVGKAMKSIDSVRAAAVKAHQGPQAPKRARGPQAPNSTPGVS